MMMKKTIRELVRHRFSFVDMAVMSIGSAVWSDKGVWPAIVVWTLGGMIARLVEMVSNADAG